MPNWFIDLAKLIIGNTGLILLIAIIGGLISVIIDSDEWTGPVARILSAVAIPFCLLIMVGIFGMTWLGWK